MWSDVALPSNSWQHKWAQTELVFFFSLILFDPIIFFSQLPVYLTIGVMDDGSIEGEDRTLMSAETLISGGVRVMDGHCWGPSLMPIQDRANSP